MLKVKNITKYYGNFLAVDNLSFDVKEGEIFGLLGINGAGKTTTFRMIMGLLALNNGSITLNDKKIDYNLTDKIGFLTEERSLLLKLTVKEQADFYGHLKGMTTKAINERLEYLLDRFKVNNFKNKKIKELSKGNQQKIQFIMAILHEPKLLILDEPFSGLDPINIELFKDIILEMKNKKTIIIFSTHRMDHVEYFCENLVVLVNGKTVLSGSVKQIKKNFGRKNIKIIGDIDIKELKKIDGVLDITKNMDEYTVKIHNDITIDKVFKIISKSKNIMKYVVEEATLNEIFIDKVGESYEK